VDDDMRPVDGLTPPPRPDPKHVALGFALEIHRPDGHGYADTDTVLATADKITEWFAKPEQGTSFGSTPLWALHLQRMVQQVLNKLGVEMASLADIQNTVQELVATDGTIIASIDKLKAEVDAGGTVTSADLDGLNSTIQGELAKLQDAVNRDDPPVPAPAPVDPNPSPTGP
jgi:hypothetical protein